MRPAVRHDDEPTGHRAVVQPLVGRGSRRRTAPPRRPGASRPCSASSTTATRSAREPQNGALTCQPSGRASPLPTTMLPRAPPTTTSRPPGTSAAAPAAHGLVRADEVQDDVGAGSPSRPSASLDRGRRAVGAEVRRPGRGPRGAGRRPPRARSWSPGGSARPGGRVRRRRSRAPCTRPPARRAAADRVVGGEAGVGERREHGRRHPVGGDEVALRRAAGRSPPVPVAAQPAARPGRRGRRSGCPGRAGSCGTRRRTRRRGRHRRGRRASRRRPRRPRRPGRRPRGRGSAGGRRAGCPRRSDITKRSEWHRPTARTSTRTSRPRGVGHGHVDQLDRLAPAGQPVRRHHRSVTARRDLRAAAADGARGSRRCRPGARPT